MSGSVREAGKRSFVRYAPIGVVRSPFKTPAEAPRQPRWAKGVKARVEVDPAFAEGLRDLEGFSHVVLLTHLHRSRGFRLRVIPPMDVALRGVFATRSPRRPNPIGLSVVRLRRIEGTTLHIEGIDVIDGTPLLDIKPYLPEPTDARLRIGWLTGTLARHGRHRPPPRHRARRAA